MKSNPNQITCFQIKSFVLNSNHYQWFNHVLNQIMIWICTSLLCTCSIVLFGLMTTRMNKYYNYYYYYYYYYYYSWEVATSTNSTFFGCDAVMFHICIILASAILSQYPNAIIIIICPIAIANRFYYLSHSYML